MPVNWSDESLQPNGLQTLDTTTSAGGATTYAAPDSRVGSVASVVGRIGQLKNDEITRSNRRAKIQGLIDGNPPKNIAKLREQGRADETNFNLREGEGMVDAAKTPYYSLIFRTQRFANIRLRYGQDSNKSNEWSEFISNRFHEMLGKWRSHGTQVQLKQWQMSVFGLGVCMWEDEDTPFWKAIRSGDVLVPDGTEADIEKLEECAVPVRGGYSPVDLFNLVGKSGTPKPDGSTPAGWYPERVKKAIVRFASDETKKLFNVNNNQRTEEWQASLRRGDTGWHDRKSRVPAVHYLAKEFSGKVTHCVVLDDGSFTGNQHEWKYDEIEDSDSRLLFKKVERFDSFMQVLCPFFWDVGTGEWHSVKGLGPKIFDFCNESNLLSCALIEGGKLGAGILFQAKDANSFQNTGLINIGHGYLVPPEWTVLQTRIQDNLQGPLAVKGELQKTLQSNTGQYRQRVSDENMEPTLGQAQLNYQQQGQLSDGAVDRYMTTYDQLYTEMVRRAFKLGNRLSLLKNKGVPPSSVQGNGATEQGKNYEVGVKNGSLTPNEALVREFFDGCLEDGVPLEALSFDNVCTVKTVRGIGNGNPVSTDMATQGGMQLLPVLAEPGRNWVIRNRAAFLFGQGNVDSIVPRYDETQLPDDHVALATLENNALKTPDGEVVVTDSQDHAVHFQVHFQDTAQDVQALKAGQADPMKVLIHLHQSGPHMKEHLDKMSGDPTRKAQLAPMQKGWLMLSKIADQLQQQIEEHLQSQQANQPPPQPDPALVAAMAKVQGELQIKQFVAQGNYQLKAQKQDQAMRLKDLMTAHSAKTKERQQVIDALGNMPNVQARAAQTPGQPFVVPTSPMPSAPQALPEGAPSPAQKVSESLSYKDAPEDIKRQIERQAGLEPSRLPAAQPPAVSQK